MTRTGTGASATPDDRPAAAWITGAPDGCVVAIRVIPRAGRDAIAGLRGDALLVRLAAAPVDGAANEALLAQLAGALGVPKRRLRIVAGEHARDKRVHALDVTPAAALARLGPIARDARAARETE
jgi:uncharacterized protein (TIGR00251 family)